MGNLLLGLGKMAIRGHGDGQPRAPPRPNIYLFSRLTSICTWVSLEWEHVSMSTLTIFQHRWVLEGLERIVGKSIYIFALILACMYILFLGLTSSNSVLVVILYQ